MNPVTPPSAAFWADCKRREPAWAACKMLPYCAPAGADVPVRTGDVELGSAEKIDGGSTWAQLGGQGLGPAIHPN